MSPGYPLNITSKVKVRESQIAKKKHISVEQQQQPFIGIWQPKDWIIQQSQYTQSHTYKTVKNVCLLKVSQFVADERVLK